MTTTSALARRRTLGSSDLEVSELCLGGNVFGWIATQDESFEVLDAYVAAGGNFIDTADAYSDWKPGNSGGESEAIIGNWIASRGNRDAVVIATKVGKLSTAAGLSADTIIRAAENSLARLRTDHIDLYYAHMDDRAVPLEESLGAFDSLVQSGKVRYIAASNFTGERLAEALEVSQQEGFASFIALQNHYNLMERKEYEDDIRSVVAQHGLGSLPYYSLARGFLTGKYRGDFVTDSPRAKGVEQYMNERGERVLVALESCADERGTSIASIALAWLLAQPTITAPIASARNLEQLDQLLGLSTVTLTDAEIAGLDRASA